jgi:DNA polymerase III delta prime subunit
MNYPKVIPDSEDPYYMQHVPGFFAFREQERIRRMKYVRLRRIAENHHLEVTDELLEAMHQAAGEAAQEMRGRYLDALHKLDLPDELLTEINRMASYG